MDLEDRRSRFGFDFFVNHGLVLWVCRKQASCASSTTQAEYLATSSTTKEIISHRRLLSNSVNSAPLLPICSPTTKVFCVLSKILNILMSTTTSFAKHFQPIPSSLPLSRLMINWLIRSKALPKEIFQRMCHQLGMYSVEH